MSEACSCTELGYGERDPQVDCPVHGLQGVFDERPSVSGGFLASGGLWVAIERDGSRGEGAMSPGRSAGRVSVEIDTDTEFIVDRAKLATLMAERDRYWQALVDIADWENWQRPTWREIAQTALVGRSGRATEGEDG